MRKVAAVAYSSLDPNVLADWLAGTYGLPAPVRCSLVSPGVNDTYEVVSGAGTAYFRVYRAGLRSQADVAFEVDLLRHLEQAGVSVSVPVAAADGSLVTQLEAPEGVRPAVLLTAAPGKVLAYAQDDAYTYGCAVANLHTAMDTFQSPWSRFHLDLDHLLDQPLRRIQPFAEDLGLWSFYTELADRLRARVQAVAPALEWGLCHGDLHGHNVHKNEEGRLTFFDFDCGGPGWRAYDLAVYRWAVGRHAKGMEPWEAFLSGYRSQREVSQVDLDITPVFVATRNYWLLGLHASQVNQRGTASVRQWVEGAVPVLRGLEKELFG